MTSNSHEHLDLAARVRLEDVWSQLRWPLLFRAGAMALSPRRIAVGFAAVVAAWGIGLAFDAVRGPALTADEMGVAAALRFGAVHPDGPAASVGVFAFVAVEAPVSTSVLVLLWIGLLSFPLTLIARSAALEITGEVDLPLSDAVRFVAGRAWSVVGVALAPVLVLGGAALALALASAVLVGTPGLGLLGAAGYGVLLLVGLGLVCLGGLAAAAAPMLHGAVAVEATDATDAIQRSMSYAAARPLSYGVLVLLACAQLAVIVGLAGAALRAAAALVLAGSFWFTAAPETGVRLALIDWWTGLFVLLAPAFAISVAGCSGSLLYLLMRRSIDGQDLGDVWTPEGVAPGTFAGRGVGPGGSGLG